MASPYPYRRVARSPLLFIFASLFLPWTTLPARAQTLWPTPLDTVHVVARRPVTGDLLPRRAAFATVVPLGADAPAGRDLGDLLDRTAGLQIHRYGGLGSFTLAGVRGSTPGQVLVCLDGVPLASAGDGFVDLAQLPVSSFGRAEVYRGPQVSTFGGPPAAGVINLVTPAVVSTPLRVSLAGGSFATRIARAQWGGTKGSCGLLLSGQYRASEGDFPYRDRNGTLFGNTSDDRTVRRANNDFADAALLWKGSWRGRGVPLGETRRLDYTGQQFSRDGGVPGTESVQTRHVRFRADRLRHELSTRLPIAVAWPIALEGSVHYERVRDRYDNRDGEVGLGRAATDNRTVDTGGRGGLSFSVPAARQETRVALDLRTEEWTPRDRLRGTTGYSRTRRHRTVTLADRLALGRLSFEGAYRWARAADNFGGPVGWGQPAGPSPQRILSHQGPTFGVRAECGYGLALKANRGRIARFPTFPELFGQNGVQEGNPALRPETGIQWDAGFSFAPPWPVRLEAAYFETLVGDRITLIQNSQRTVKAMNLDRAWVRGVESSGIARLVVGVRSTVELQGSFTWQEGVDVGASATYHGKRLPNLPAREAYLSASLEQGPWTGRWETAARSAHFRDRYNAPAKRTAGSVVHDLSLQRRLHGQRLTLAAEVRNLFDRRVEDIDGFPLPGRSVLVEASVTFGRGQSRPARPAQAPIFGDPARPADRAADPEEVRS